MPPSSAVSEPCKELLRKILRGDPPSRMAIPEMIEHPWFQVNLPDVSAPLCMALPARGEGSGF